MTYKVEGIIIEVALQYNDSFSETVESFANVINTVEGGSHLTGFRMALTRSINDYSKKIGAVKENEEALTGEDMREGLTAVVTIKMSSDKLEFEGQTKTKLGNAEIQPLVNTTVKSGLDTFLEENPADAHREGEDGDQREAGRLQERPEGVAEIMGHGCPWIECRSLNADVNAEC